MGVLIERRARFFGARQGDMAGTLRLRRSRSPPAVEAVNDFPLTVDRIGRGQVFLAARTSISMRSGSQASLTRTLAGFNMRAVHDVDGAHERSLCATPSAIACALRLGLGEGRACRKRPAPGQRNNSGCET